MIQPEGIPISELTNVVSALDANVAPLSGLGQQFTDVGNNTHGAFQGLNDVYHAPEREVLVNSTLKIKQNLGDFGPSLPAMSKHLTNLANEVRGKLGTLKDIRNQAYDWHRQKDGNPDWQNDQHMIDWNNQMVNDVHKIVKEDIPNLCFQCANAIVALFGGKAWDPKTGLREGQQPPPENKQQGDPPPEPWGTTEERDMPLWEDCLMFVPNLLLGALQVVGETVEGLLTLVPVLPALGSIDSVRKWAKDTFGYDIPTWESAGAAWKGLGTLAVNLVTAPVQLVWWGFDKATGMDTRPQFVKDLGEQGVEMLKGMVAWDEWSKNPGKAFGMALTNIGATVASFGAGGAIRDAAMAGKLGMASATVAKVAKVADFASGIKAGIHDAALGAAMKIPKVGQVIEQAAKIPIVGHNFKMHGVPKVDVPTAATPEIGATSHAGIDSPHSPSVDTHAPSVDAPSVHTPSVDAPSVHTPSVDSPVHTPGVDSPVHPAGVNSPAPHLQGGEGPGAYRSGDPVNPAPAAHADPMTASPSHVEPGTTTPVTHTEPGTTTSRASHAEPSTTPGTRAEPSTTPGSRTEPSTTPGTRTDPGSSPVDSRTDPSTTPGSRTEPTTTPGTRTDPGSTTPGTRTTEPRNLTHDPAGSHTPDSNTPGTTHTPESHTAETPGTRTPETPTPETAGTHTPESHVPETPGTRTPESNTPETHTPESAPPDNLSRAAQADPPVTPVMPMHPGVPGHPGAHTPETPIGPRQSIPDRLAGREPSISQRLEGEPVPRVPRQSIPDRLAGKEPSIAERLEGVEPVGGRTPEPGHAQQLHGEHTPTDHAPEATAPHPQEPTTRTPDPDPATPHGPSTPHDPTATHDPTTVHDPAAAHDPAVVDDPARTHDPSADHDPAATHDPAEHDRAGHDAANDPKYDDPAARQVEVDRMRPDHLQPATNKLRSDVDPHLHIDPDPADPRWGQLIEHVGEDPVGNVYDWVHRVNPDHGLSKHYDMNCPDVSRAVCEILNGERPRLAAGNALKAGEHPATTVEWMGLEDVPKEYKFERPPHSSPEDAFKLDQEALQKVRDALKGRPPGTHANIGIDFVGRGGHRLTAFVDKDGSVKWLDGQKSEVPRKFPDGSAEQRAAIQDKMIKHENQIPVANHIDRLEFSVREPGGEWEGVKRAPESRPATQQQHDGRPRQAQEGSDTPSWDDNADPTAPQHTPADDHTPDPNAPMPPGAHRAEEPPSTEVPRTPETPSAPRAPESELSIADRLAGRTEAPTVPGEHAPGEHTPRGSHLDENGPNAPTREHGQPGTSHPEVPRAPGRSLSDILNGVDEPGPSLADRLSGHRPSEGAHHPEWQRSEPHRPETHTPESYAPETHVPESHVPETHAPETHVPGSHVPEGHLPESHVPESHAPQGHVPESHVPGSHVPEGHVPETHTPGPPRPESHTPETHTPEPHGPESHTPESHAPETHVPETHAPETRVPESHAPEVVREPVTGRPEDYGFEPAGEPRKLITDDGKAKYLDEYRAAAENWGPDTLDDLEQYVGSAANRVNSWLRNPEKGRIAIEREMPHLVDWMDRMDNLLRDAPRAAEPRTLYRGLQAPERIKTEAAFREWLDETFTLGDDFATPGFSHTSIAPDIAAAFAKGQGREYGVVMEIKTPQGVPVGYGRHAEFYEGEYALPSGFSPRVVGISEGVPFQRMGPHGLVEEPNIVIHVVDDSVPGGGLPHQTPEPPSTHTPSQPGSSGPGSPESYPAPDRPHTPEQPYTPDPRYQQHPAAGQPRPDYGQPQPGGGQQPPFGQQPGSFGPTGGHVPEGQFPPPRPGEQPPFGQQPHPGQQPPYGQPRQPGSFGPSGQVPEGQFPPPRPGEQPPYGQQPHPGQQPHYGEQPSYGQPRQPEYQQPQQPHYPEQPPYGQAHQPGSFRPSGQVPEGQFPPPRPGEQPPYGQQPHPGQQPPYDQPQEPRYGQQPPHGQEPGGFGPSGRQPEGQFPPASHGEQPPFGQPHQPEYGQPHYGEQPPYGQPRQPEYGEPRPPEYAQPQQPRYGEQTPYGQPRQPEYGRPQGARYPGERPEGQFPPASRGEQPPYGQPRQPEQGQPGQPPYGRPGEPRYGEQPPYGQPRQPEYGPVPEARQDGQPPFGQHPGQPRGPHAGEPQGLHRRQPRGPHQDQPQGPRHAQQPGQPPASGLERSRYQGGDPVEAYQSHLPEHGGQPASHGGHPHQPVSAGGQRHEPVSSVGRRNEPVSSVGRRNDGYDVRPPERNEFVTNESPKLEDAYRRIRDTVDDVPKVADAAGLDPALVDVAKQNVFVKTHNVAIGPGDIRHGNFTPLQQIADLWDAATSGRPLTQAQSNELRSLIAHEAMEAKLIQSGVPYNFADPKLWDDGYYDFSREHAGAHQVAPRSMQSADGVDLLQHWRRLGLTPPPGGLAADLSNLDEVIRIAREGMGW